MRWHVALAMGLMAWVAYALTRNRPATTRLAFAPPKPGNGRSRPDPPSSAVPVAVEASVANEAEASRAPSTAVVTQGDSVTTVRHAPGEARALIRVSWIVRVPEGAPPGDFVYLCGNHAALGHWNPMGVALHRVASGLCQGELRMPAGTRFEYKFTRGTWASVEVLESGAHRPNRLLDLDRSAVLESEIEAWADQV